MGNGKYYIKQYGSSLWQGFQRDNNQGRTGNFQEGRMVLNLEDLLHNQQNCEEMVVGIGDHIGN